MPKDSSAVLQSSCSVLISEGACVVLVHALTAAATESTGCSVAESIYSIALHEDSWRAARR
jgi:hypothetical protein